jgi:hypothetical protein
MLIYDDAGVPTNDSPLRIDGTGVVRAIVRESAFEGIESWFIGFDGPGCVTVGGDATGQTVVVTVAAG